MSVQEPPSATGDDGKAEGRRARQRERLLAMVARSPFRSSLFWWLFEHHDQWVAEAASSRIGMSWATLCRGFTEMGLTNVDGLAVKPETARKTWQRVRKEKARLREAEAKAEAERAFQRARDPRRYAPSRLSGSYPAPLADRQPPRPDPTPAPSPVGVTVVAATGQMPGDPVLTGGIEETLPASEFTVIFEGKPLDLRLFIAPNDKRPWDLPEFSIEDRIRALKMHLDLRFDHWKKDRVRNPYNRVDMEWRKRLGKS